MADVPDGKRRTTPAADGRIGGDLSHTRRRVIPKRRVLPEVRRIRGDLFHGTDACWRSDT